MPALPYTFWDMTLCVIVTPEYSEDVRTIWLPRTGRFTLRGISAVYPPNSSDDVRLLPDVRRVPCEVSIRLLKKNAQIHVFVPGESNPPVSLYIDVEEEVALD
jgi:hypothetical protein